MKLPLIRAALSTAAVIGLLAFSVAPAQADAKRQLPTGDSLYAISCDDSTANGALFSVTTDSGALSEIVAATPSSTGCAGQPAWDAVTKTVYTIGYADYPTTILQSVNLISGITTDVAEFTLDSEGLYADALAISPSGVGYVTNGSDLYTVDLTGVTAGELTIVGPIDADNLYGLAFAPAGVTNGTLYAVSSYGVVYTIDIETGEATEIAELDLTPEMNVYSLQVDSSGILWIENNGADSQADLWSVDPITGDSTIKADSAQLSSTLNIEGVAIYTESLLIVPVALPVFGTPSALSVVAGKAFSFTPAASGTPAEGYTYTGTLPAGVTFDTATGTISGTVTTAGTYTFTFVATNASGATPQTFTLTVTAAAIVFPITGG